MGDEGTQKIAWKRAELAVNRFKKTAEADVIRLTQFKKNIVEYEKSGDRSSVKMELSRAQQTIYQLQSNLNSIQKIRKDIRDQDVLKFDTKMTTIRMEIMEEIKKFAQLDSAHIEYLGEEFSDLLKEGLASSPSLSPTLPIQTQQVEDMQKSQLAAELSVAQNQEEQIVRLAEDVGHAKDIMTTLNGMVQQQGETIDSIENNVETAHHKIEAGGVSLNKTLALKTAGFAVIGAVAGALVGGPVGLFAGAKLGTLAAGTGMIAGAAAGNKLKNMQLETNETEMQNLQAAADTADTKSLRSAVAKNSVPSHNTELKSSCGSGENY